MHISKRDQRKYTHYIAPGGLRVLLVQDLGCNNAAVSMSIKAGHFHDPEEVCGLAHILEHMLFLGSENYSEPNSLQHFLSSHSGNLNAWTGTEHANFHFDVNDSYLINALDIFFDMLTHPLVSEQSLDKEINSIDAEFKLKINDDLRRLYQVHKETCNPKHPFSKFSVGNEQTLRSVELTELQTLLREFHNKHYVAENMALCIISKHPADQLEKQLATLLTDVNCAAPVRYAPYPTLYLPDQLGVKINIKPLKVARRMIISFALPDVQHYYKCKPLDFISHLLGDEGSGSLLHYFKQQNWVTNLSAGGGINGSNFKDFNLNLQLTESGIENTENILNSVFYYIKLITDHLDEKWRYEEKAKLGKLAFNFSDQVKPLEDAIHLSNQLFFYAKEDILSGDYLTENFDTDPIEACLSLMTPQNMRVKLIHPEVETDKIAKWYETPYQITPFPNEFLAALSKPQRNDALHLPDKNPFIISSTERQETSPQYEQPTLITSQAGMNIWFGQDSVFDLPKGDCFVSFDCPAVYKGPEISAYKRIWIAMLMEHFNNRYYHAGVAGLNFHLYSHQAGFSLHTNGFTQKQLTLAKSLFEHIHEFTGSIECFEQVRQKNLNSLQNSLLNKPINRLFTRLSGIVQRLTHSPTELIPILQEASIERMEQVRTELLNEYFLEGFIYGDWQLAQGNSFSQFLAKSRQDSHSTEKIKRDVTDLRQQQSFLHQVESQHQDAAVVVYYQTPTASAHDVALTILLEQMLAAPFFNEMRTEKQLGYIVGSGYLPLNRHPGLAFYIQSPNCNAKTLKNEIEHYIDESTSTIAEFEPIWKQIKTSVIKQLTDNDTNLTVKSQRLWMAIGNDDNHFDQQVNMAMAMQQLTFDQVVNFAQRLNSNQGFGKLVLFCAGSNQVDNPTQGTIIKDISDYKLKSKYMV